MLFDVHAHVLCRQPSPDVALRPTHGKPFTTLRFRYISTAPPLLSSRGGETCSQCGGYSGYSPSGSLTPGQPCPCRNPFRWCSRTPSLPSRRGPGTGMEPIRFLPIPAGSCLRGRPSPVPSHLQVHATGAGPLGRVVNRQLFSNCSLAFGGSRFSLRDANITPHNAARRSCRDTSRHIRSCGTGGSSWGFPLAVGGRPACPQSGCRSSLVSRYQCSSPLSTKSCTAGVFCTLDTTAWAGVPVHCANKLALDRAWSESRWSAV